MRAVILLLPLLVGCSADPSRYTPVNWESEPSPPRHQPPELQPDEPAVDINQRLLQLHNNQREQKGRPSFVIDQELCIYAQQWANRMAKENDLYHSDMNNILKLNRFYTAGENIAWKQRSPEQVVNDWMNSSGHRANIMNRNFTHIGFGATSNSRGEIYWCTVFGG